MSPLAARLRPPGPVVSRAGEAVLAELEAAAGEGGWRDLFEQARSALEPVLAASPYLASLVRRRADRLREVLAADPERRLADLLAAASALRGGAEAMRSPLRRLKADLHLLTALCDLGGVWSLEAATAALSDFADQAVRAALRAVVLDARERGRLLAEPGSDGACAGLFGLAMGKHGARELNFSSDIDVTFFHAPDRLAEALAPGVEPQAFADRAVGALARLLSERTAEGYVFRVDLRLRPDPASTPPVVAAPAALNYYETVGQNWERAAFIKARAVAGDLAAAERFLAAVQPFIWRRSLDYGAIADIHSIKRQIHVHRADERPEAAGADLKLGRGGIREIEFYVQTQQLILGGRQPALRSSRTLEALAALSGAGHVSDETASELTEAYRRLRDLEHRIQMLEDEQTHALPVDAARRAAIAALSGHSDLEAFDREVSALLARVNARYGELFAGDESLSSDYGSLVFTGVENDPETLRTLERMGFADSAGVSETIRGWHHGRIGPTRSARGRELFTRLAPRLLEACARTGAADVAFQRFARFFEPLKAGVQVQALFLAQPRLFELIVETLAWSPQLARTLARRAAALDAVMDSTFFQPITADSGVTREIERQATEAPDFEEAMNRVRRLHREQAFRISLQILSGAAPAVEAGAPFSDLAEACVRGLAEAAMIETRRQGGALEGRVAVLALGKLGSREMSAASDLDLMTVYEAEADAMSTGRGWSGDVWFGRFTQRLIAALSAPTAEGGLYEVDIRLRPSGTAGPVAVSLRAFQDYYGRDADAWEFMALTRARVVWSNDSVFAGQVGEAIDSRLRRPRDRGATLHDAAAMRDLMNRERPPWGFWDMKRSPGGLIDCEFVAQAVQLVSASDGGPLRVSTLEALQALADHGALSAGSADRLVAAWRLHQTLGQLMRTAIARRTDPAGEPVGFQERLARAAGLDTLEALQAHVAQVRADARAAWREIFGAAATD